MIEIQRNTLPLRMKLDQRNSSKKKIQEFLDGALGKQSFFSVKNNVELLMWRRRRTTRKMKVLKEIKENENCLNISHISKQCDNNKKFVLYNRISERDGMVIRKWKWKIYNYTRGIKKQSR